MTLKEKLKEVYELRKDYNYISNLDFNILYFLAKNNYHLKTSSTLLSVDELLEVLDNLAINNEIITSDNLDEYDTKKLKLTKNQIKSIKNGSKVLLLNYYTFSRYCPYEMRLITHKQPFLTDCRIFLKNINDKILFLEG